MAYRRKGAALAVCVYVLVLVFIKGILIPKQFGKVHKMDIRLVPSAAGCVVALALSFINPAGASIIGVTDVTFTLSESPVVNGTETFSLQIHLAPPANGNIGAGVFGTIDLSPGDGELDIISVPGGTTGGTFTQQVTYSVAGLYTPSYSFTGTAVETANAGFIVPNDESISVSGNFAQLNVSPVPEPSTWAMLLLGFAGIGFAACRRKTLMAA
jgi:hypothetical protein